MQSEQTCSPVEEVNLPATHLVQNEASLFLLNFPTAQTVQFVAPGGLNFPAVQLMQDDLPFMLLYLPISQAVQASISVSVALLVRYFPLAQKVHLAKPTPEKEPMSQEEQSAAEILLYFPAVQFVQASVSFPV